MIAKVHHKVILWFRTDQYHLLVDNEKNREPAFDIPDVREYFVDLELVLSVISDGPTKSFAFRRLKYLSGKFTMYSLLNEFQELADMKVQNLSNIVKPLFTFDFTEGSAPVCAQHRIHPSMLNRHIETFTTFEKSILMFTIQAA